MNPSKQAAHARSSGTSPGQGMAWYTVGVLTLAYLFSYIDRQILSLMVGPIKRDLMLTDTQFSLLHGLAFAIFYTLLGIPIARLADNHNRRKLIAIGVALWSLATAAGGLARNFGQLFMARIAVGVGEALSEVDRPGPLGQGRHLGEDRRAEAALERFDDDFGLQIVDRRYLDNARLQKFVC